MSITERDLEHQGSSGIIQGVIETRRLERQIKADQEEAKKLIPELKIKLATLIREHVTQEEEVVSWEENFRRGLGGNLKRHWGIQSREDYYQTVLECTVTDPSEPDPIKVTISASNYPESPEAAQNTSYQVDVEEHSSYLKIDRDEATIESKKTLSDMPSDFMHIVIGKRYNTWPAWSHPVGTKDIADYKALFATLQNGDVEFQGKTLAKRIVDPATIPEVWKSLF